jgi:DNA-binding response OmpR family regulator
MRILLIEDDDVLRRVMLRRLGEVGHGIDAALNAEDADQLWRTQLADVVLMDLNPPGGAPNSSLSALQLARARGDRTPVLALTARNRMEERLSGLYAGADDYLSKPFDIAEIEARLRVLARRVQGVEDIVTLRGLSLDRRARRFSIGGAPIELPLREFEVLWELMNLPGRTISKRELSDKLSGFNDVLGDNALEAFVSRLRKKIAGSGAAIRTLRGIGYLLEAE